MSGLADALHSIQTDHASVYTPAVGCPCVGRAASVAAILLPSSSEELRDALVGMVVQFAYWSDSAGGYHTGGLSALEDAFDALGWDDPHPAPEARCDEPGCLHQISCGWPTRPGGTGDNGGYRRTCHDHYRPPT